MQEINFGRQPRNSNIELLRIISMLCIVAHHYAVHGFSGVELDYSINRYVVGVFSLGGKLGVSCFILISGYFMVHSNITLRKLVKLIAEVWFYSVGIAVLFLVVMTPVEPLGMKDLIKAIVPIGYATYWFMTDYVILMLISPILNILLEKMSRNLHRNVILLFVVIWSVVPSFTEAGYGYNDLSWFVVLYFIAGYIRKYISVSEGNSTKHLLVAGISYLTVVLFEVFLTWADNRYHINVLSLHVPRLSLLNSPFVLLTSVELLIGSVKMKRHEYAWINKLASATLGVYLIHDNNMLRPYLWHTVLKTDIMYSSRLLIVHALLSVMGVYIVCTCIDLIRQRVVERLFLVFLDRYLQRIENGLKHFGKYIENKGQIFLHSYYGSDLFDSVKYETKK